jgi:hypothetical protein
VVDLSGLTIVHDQPVAFHYRRISRTELSARVWEPPHEYDTKLVEVFIGRLKRKIGETSPDSYGAPLVTSVLLFPNCTKLSATTRCGY